jgi:ribosome biogenesis ATPase
MQSLWSTHKRTKLNLNASPGSTGIATPPAGDLPSATDGPDGNLATAVSDTADLPTVTSGKRKNRMLRPPDEINKRSKLSKEYPAPTARLSDLGGVEDCIEKMLELVAMPLCHPEVYLHTGVQPPRGVLLHGPPGCGKTLLANAIAGVSLIYGLTKACLTFCSGIGCTIH